eukprot:9468132-Pyramimonas_sp.AAC.1
MVGDGRPRARRLPNTAPRWSGTPRQSGAASNGQHGHPHNAPECGVRHSVKRTTRESALCAL